MLIQQKN